MRARRETLQEGIADSLGRLQKLVPLRVIPEWTNSGIRISGDMSDLMYGTTDLHIAKEFKVNLPKINDD